MLNYDHPLGQDWRGLAATLDLTAAAVYEFERRQNPTREVLKIWDEEGKTVEDLRVALEEMERIDCAEKVQEYIDKGT